MQVPAPASTLEAVRQHVNAGRLDVAVATFRTLPPAERDAAWLRLRRLTAPSLHGPSYAAVGARLREGVDR